MSICCTHTHTLPVGNDAQVAQLGWKTYLGDRVMQLQVFMVQRFPKGQGSTESVSVHPQFTQGRKAVKNSKETLAWLG